jgi:GPI-anchor transamidase subunit K
MVSFFLRVRQSVLRKPMLLLLMTMMFVALLPQQAQAQSQTKARAHAQAQAQARQPLQPSNHTSNHAVILSSSRFWFNYRHAVNALAIYNLIRQNGIPDENIILMLADDIPANPRNPFKNQVFYETITTKANSRTRPITTHKPSSLIDSHVQIDYRGDDVTVDNLRNVLLGTNAHMGGDATDDTSTQHPTMTTAATTRRTGRVLHTDQHSNVLIYWTGHGGDSFFKFQDVEEITSVDIRRILQDMKFQSLLFLADTCQAFTLGNQLLSSSATNADPKNVYMIGSSLQNENSYAHHADADLGVSVIERYTFQFVQFIQTHMKRNRGTLSGLSLADAMVNHFEYHQQGAHVGVTRTSGTKPLEHVPLSDFFAAPTTTSKSATKTTSSVLMLLDKHPTTTSDWTRALKDLSPS